MENAISVEHLVYEVGMKGILNDVHLEVEKGRIVSIMGQSGSGKTTLLKLMTGLLRATSGQIVIDGTDITRLREREMDQVRLKLGLVFQYAALFDSLTVYDNIVFSVVRHHRYRSREDLDDIVRTLLADVGLEGVEDRRPSELSGGMQKRVGLARALAMKPSIVFYDEPTSGLDPITANTIDELIMDTRKRTGVTSVVVSHDLQSIFRISDHVAMLDRGKIIAFGTPAEIQASSNTTVKEFLHPQAHQ